MPISPAGIFEVSCTILRPWNSNTGKYYRYYSRTATQRQLQEGPKNAEPKEIELSGKTSKGLEDAKTGPGRETQNGTSSILKGYVGSPPSPPKRPKHLAVQLGSPKVRNCDTPRSGTT